MAKKNGITLQGRQVGNTRKAKVAKKSALDRAFSSLDSLIRDAEGNYYVKNDPQCIGYMGLVSRLSTAMTAYMQADARQGLIDGLDGPRVSVKFALAQIDREKACIDEQLEALLKESMVFCGADAHMQPGYEAAAASDRKEIEKKFGPIKTLTKEECDRLAKATSPKDIMEIVTSH